MVTTKAEALHDSIDGRELREDDVDPASHRWLIDPQRVFPRLHLRGIQVRGGLLASKSRVSRGRPIPIEDKRCRGVCGATETLNHILQICHTTHNARCERHNRVMRLVERKTRPHVTASWIEPIIPTTSSFIKPDVVVQKADETILMDITIVSSARLAESWRLKEEKYNSPTNRQAISEWDESKGQLRDLSIVISTRGLMYGPSGRGLRGIGLGNRDIMDLCLMSILGSIKIYDCYMNCTQ